MICSVRLIELNSVEIKYNLVPFLNNGRNGKNVLLYFCSEFILMNNVCFALTFSLLSPSLSLYLISFIHRLCILDWTHDGSFLYLGLNDFDFSELNSLNWEGTYHHCTIVREREGKRRERESERDRKRERIKHYSLKWI